MCRFSPRKGREANEKLKLISILTRARHSVPERTGETVWPGAELCLSEVDFRARRPPDPEVPPAAALIYKSRAMWSTRNTTGGWRSAV